VESIRTRREGKQLVVDSNDIHKAFDNTGANASKLAS
jgi:hypothetical protein